MKEFLRGDRLSSVCINLPRRIYPNLGHVFSYPENHNDLLDIGFAKNIGNLGKHASILGTAQDALNSYLSTPFSVLEAFNFGGEALLPDEPTELVTLRREVEELKRQVTVLAGLVQLRAEPPTDPLAAAKSRGASYMKAEFEQADNLSLAAASEYSGRSDRMINLERNRGALYALILEGNTRGYRYPKWQFDVPSSRLRQVLDVLTSSSISCWSMHNFLTRPHSDLDGRTPGVAIGDSEFPIERIIAVARLRVDQQQGAS